jgi:hypothetical protein
MAATKDRFLQFEIGDYAHLPLAAGAKVFRHTFIGQVTGTNTFRPLVAADKFAGVSQDSSDNTGGAAAAKDVQVKREGRLLETVTGATAATAIGTSVYASADDTLTTTAASNSLMGKIGGYDVATGKSFVDFWAAGI